jgi:hypothetical protein
MVRHGDGVEFDQVATHDVVLLRRGDVTIRLNHRNEMVSRRCDSEPGQVIASSPAHCIIWAVPMLALPGSPDGALG